MMKSLLFILLIFFAFTAGGCSETLKGARRDIDKSGTGGIVQTLKDGDQWFRENFW